MNALRFGLEIEVEYRKFRYPYDGLSLPAGWQFGTDLSVHEKYGRELRSPILTRYPNDLLKTILSEIKRNGGEINSTCGTHIHFSGIELSDIQRFQLTEFLIKKIPNWQSRNYWCRFVGKYKVIRTVNEREMHYEARIFNGSLNPRAIRQYFKILLKGLGSVGADSSFPGL